NALPLALAALAGALERIAQTVGLVHGGGVDGALLATARVGVGHLGIDLRIAGDLLLAQDNAVLDEDIPAAVAHAVDAVSGVANAVPGPLVAIHVFPAAVRILAGQDVADRLEAIERPDVATKQGSRTGHPQPFQDVASLDLEHRHTSPHPRRAPLRPLCPTGTRPMPVRKGAGSLSRQRHRNPRS